VKFIGIVFADNCIKEGYVAAVNVKRRSFNCQTSIYPPTFNTEKFVPNTAVLSTESVDAFCIEVIGFLYSNDI
jgi:hypothetical protein